MRNMKLDRRYCCGGGLREKLNTLKTKNDSTTLVLVRIIVQKSKSYEPY
jgi:hypothetical protein